MRRGNEVLFPSSHLPYAGAIIVKKIPNVKKKKDKSFSVKYTWESMPFTTHLAEQFLHPFIHKAQFFCIGTV